MKIGIIGAGRIGGNAARMFTRAGHEVLVSFSRDPDTLPALAAELGDRARVGTAAEAATFGPVVMISVPWPAVDAALATAGSLAGKIVIDTTNQFIPGGLDDLGTQTAAQLNQARMPGARLVKAFNTLTAGFQAEAAGRVGADRVVLFLCGDDTDAKTTVAGLIDDAGFVPVDLGAWPTPPRWRRPAVPTRYMARNTTKLGPGLCRPVPVSPALRNRTTRLKVRSERGTLPRHGNSDHLGGGVRSAADGAARL